MPFKHRIKGQPTAITLAIPSFLRYVFTDHEVNHLIGISSAIFEDDSSLLRMLSGIHNKDRKAGEMGSDAPKRRCS